MTFVRKGKENDAKPNEEGLSNTKAKVIALTQEMNKEKQNHICFFSFQKHHFRQNPQTLMPKITPKISPFNTPTTVQIKPNPNPNRTSINRTPNYHNWTTTTTTTTTTATSFSNWCRRLNVGLGAGSVRVTSLHPPLPGAALPAAGKCSHGGIRKLHH